MASNNIFQKAEDWLDDLETVGTYAAEKIGDVTKDMPIVKSLGAIAANPTRQEIGAQFGNLASAANKGMQESFGGDPVDMALNYGVAPMGITKKIYHGTNKIFKDFDIKKSADGTIWFTDDPQKIIKGEVAASGKGRIVARVIDEDKLKLATWDDIDKYSVDELISQGYDGVKMEQAGEPTTYQIFNPNKLQKAEDFLDQ